MKKMKLGSKIMIGFSAVLALLVLVGFIGYYGLTGVTDRVEKADDVSRMVNLLLEARQQEKNYIIRGKDVSRSGVAKVMNDLTKQIETTRAKFTDNINLGKMDETIEHAAAYQKSFNNYVEFNKKKSEAAIVMVDRAQATMALCEEISISQKKQLGVAREETDKTTASKLVIVSDANKLIQLILNARAKMLIYMATRDSTAKAEWDKLNQTIYDLITGLKSSFKDLYNLEQIDSIASRYREYEAAFKKYLMTRSSSEEEKMNTIGEEVVSLIGLIIKEQNDQLVEVRKKSAAVVSSGLHLADMSNQLIKSFLTTRLDEQRFIISRDMNLQKKMNDDIGEMLAAANEIKAAFKDKANIEKITKVIDNINSYKTAYDDFVSLKIEQDKAGEKMVAAARGAEKVFKETRSGQKEAMTSQIDAANIMIGLISLTAVLVGLVLAWLITRSITKPLNRIIDGLSAGSDQVDAASTEVSSASQSLAEGSSEQAAALEETTASMEEMGSQTKSNAENADRADALMRQTGEVINEAGQSMDDMSESMGRIAEAGSEIGKIVKSIDEIAFQTNLLALNAAVEAARAGEAGAGFAVVADEVRALAMRAAEAAKNTQELVEDTIRRIEQGSVLVKQTKTGFDQVTESTSEVGELVSEIASASKEQSQGIDQVNKAMVQMDQITQRVAANAEESASASEELSSQAAQMREMVIELTAMVHSRGNPPTHRSEPRHAPKLKLTDDSSASDKKNKVVRAAEVIPFDDDLEDF